MSNCKDQRPFSNPQVQAVFDSYPEPVKSRLLELRQLIFEMARKTDGVGEIEETLKWGQPSYLTTKSRSGTTIRIDQVKSKPNQYALYVHCQTNLIETFRELYPDELTYDGKRAITFELDNAPPIEIIRHCIALAQTYHLNKVRHHL